MATAKIHLWANAALLAAISGFALPAHGEGKSTTVITTYVTTVQQERESTRWTLTEWLRIKERMKMMDVWLAMFSDPKKDHFAPELMLSYGMSRGNLHCRSLGLDQTSALSGTNAKAQIWLTNFFSSTVGIKTLNIDLGIEGFQRSTGAFAPVSSAAAATDSNGAIAADPEEGARKLKTTYYTADLRLFGKSIQDSSLVFKYGSYRSDNSIPTPLSTTATTTSDQTGVHHQGLVAGGELQAYLLNWLGAEGNYLQFGDATSLKGTSALKGTYYDYQGFFEVSLLRLSFGPYAEAWSIDGVNGPVETTETGMLGSMKVQF